MDRAESAPSSPFGYTAEWLEEAAEHHEAGRSELARCAFCRAVDIDESGVALNEYGQFLWQRGELDEALVQFERLLKVAEVRGCTALRSVAWNNLAVVHRERGDRARAAVCQQQSWRASLRLSDSSADATPGTDLTNRANDAILAGDLRLAEKLLESALNCDARAENLADEAADWGNLGIVAALTGDIDKARYRFERAFWIHRNLGDDRGLGCDLRHLGELSVAAGDWKSAHGLLERSVFHFERGGSRALADAARRALVEVARRERVASFDPARN